MANNKKTKTQKIDEKLKVMDELVQLALSLGFQVFDAEWYDELNADWKNDSKYHDTGKIIDYPKNHP